MDAPPVRNLHKGAGECSGKLAPCRRPPVVLHWPCLSEDLPSPGWLKWDETDLVSPHFFSAYKEAAICTSREEPWPAMWSPPSGGCA